MQLVGFVTNCGNVMVHFGPLEPSLGDRSPVHPPEKRVLDEDLDAKSDQDRGAEQLGRLAEAGTGDAAEPDAAARNGSSRAADHLAGQGDRKAEQEQSDSGCGGRALSDSLAADAEAAGGLRERERPREP
jgi:hypothetical protein